MRGPKRLCGGSNHQRDREDRNLTGSESTGRTDEATNLFAMRGLREDQVLGMRTGRSCSNPNKREDQTLLASIDGRGCRNPNNRDDQKLGFRARHSRRNESIKVVPKVEEVHPNNREDHKLGFRAGHGRQNESITVVAEVEEVQTDVVRLHEEVVVVAEVEEVETEVV